MKPPMMKVMLYVLGSVAAVVCAIAIIFLGLFGISLARTQQDFLLTTASSPDGKWLVKVTDHHPGGDLKPSAIVSIESTAPATFFHLAKRPYSVIYAMHDACTDNRAFDARWTSASALTITYPRCVPGPYSSPGDDSVIVKDIQWQNIRIDYELASSIKGK